MLDVNNLEALKHYLVERKISGSESTTVIQPLSGGVSNSVLKITSDYGEFVLKQALHKLKVREEWISDIERCNVEKNVLKFLNNLIPDIVPKFVYEDEDNYLFVMSCAPESAVTWKTLLMKQDCNSRIARKIGEILGTIHQKTCNLPEVQELFHDKKFFFQLRIEPFFNFLKEKHPELKGKIDQHIAHCLGNERTLVLGDYSPKNILVHEDNIIAIDFEVAHYGDPSFDLGFLTTHLLLKTIKHHEKRNDFYRVLQQTIDGYFSRIHFMKRSDLEESAVKQLAWILLARVDGKSPVEYITAEKDKQFIRNVSNEILNSNMKNFHEVITFTLEMGNDNEN